MLELSTVNDILAGIAKRDGETVAMWKSDQGMEADHGSHDGWPRARARRCDGELGNPAR